MANYKIYILLFLIIFVKNNEYWEDNDSESKVDECQNLKVDLEGSHCCLLTGKIDGKNISSCIELKPREYNDINDYIEEMNKRGGYYIKNIDCKSFYLKIELICFAFFLL